LHLHSNGQALLAHKGRCGRPSRARAEAARLRQKQGAGQSEPEADDRRKPDYTALKHTLKDRRRRDDGKRPEEFGKANRCTLATSTPPPLAE